MENHVFTTTVLVPQNTSLAISTTTINMNITQTPQYLKISDIYKIGIFTGIILLSVIGNATVIFAIIVYNSLHNVTNYFLFNMATADLLVTDMYATPYVLLVRLFISWNEQVCM